MWSYEDYLSVIECNDSKLAGGHVKYALAQTCASLNTRNVYTYSCQTSLTLLEVNTNVACHDLFHH